jgi:hypothetical protein
VAGALALLCLIATTACNKKSPIDPSLLALSSSGTRLISLSGDISFGPVPVGTTATRTLTITNTGTGPVSVTGLSTESGTATLGFTQNFTPGVIASGGTKTVTVTFAPVVGQSYGTFLTVQGNHTNGPSTIILDGEGSVDHLPLFAVSGSGNAVFEMPTHISRIRVTGKFVDTGGSPSTFVVFRNSTLEINSDLRSADFDVTGFMTGGGRVQIQNSPAIAWSFTEVR